METQILQSLILEVTEVLVQGSMHLSGKFAKDSKFKLLSIGRVIGVWLKSKLLQLKKMSKEATNVNFMFQFDEHDIKNSKMKSI